MCKGTCTIACNTNILTERITLLIVGLTLEQITPQTIPLGGNILFGIGGVIVHGFGSKQFGTPKKRPFNTLSWGTSMGKWAMQCKGMERV
jgi:hypothetical protein